MEIQQPKIRTGAYNLPCELFSFSIIQTMIICMTQKGKVTRVRDLSRVLAMLCYLNPKYAITIRSFLLIYKPGNKIESILLKFIKEKIDVSEMQCMLLNMKPKLLTIEFYNTLVMCLLNTI